VTYTRIFGYALCVVVSIGVMNVTALDSPCSALHNTTGYTPVKGQKTLKSINWLVFAEGKIIDVGEHRLPARYNNCQRIDGKGQFLLPGLIDAHGHVSHLGRQLSQVQLRGIDSEAAGVKQVQVFTGNNPDAQWILGRGWNQVLWSGQNFPTRYSLDKTGIDKPIVLSRVDGHAVWVNSLALAAAGINAHTPDPDGGKIVRDKHGVATGVLIDNAAKLVESKIPALSSAELDAVFDVAFAHLLSHGIVSVHDAGVNQQDRELYIERNKKNTLPLRIYGMLSGDSPRLGHWLAEGVMGDEYDRLSLRSVKLYSDGALGSRGAALLRPYSDDEDNRGLLLTKPQTLDNLMKDITRSGFQVNIHAIGDRGNRVVLDAFEKLLKKSKVRALRNRIEHAQVVSLDDIPRFKQLGIIASMQPTHATSDKNMAGDRIGDKRLKGAYAWQRFLAQGTIVASGSDFPVEHANPFLGLHAAVTRQDTNDLPEGGWLPKQKMNVTQALRSFTLDAAFAAHQDDRLGSLEKGKWADFILVDRDVLNVNPKDLWKTQVIETWIAGEQKYDRAGLN